MMNNNKKLNKDDELHIFNENPKYFAFICIMSISLAITYYSQLRHFTFFL